MWRGLCFWALKRIEHGTLVVTDTDGQTHTFEGRVSKFPQADISIHDDAVWRHLVLGGHRAFFHDFLNQKWCSTDLTSLFICAIENEKKIKRIIPQQGWAQSTNKFEDLTDMVPDRHQNTFFAQWLDKSLTYSGAMFGLEKISLDEAQERKFKSLCDRLALEPHHKVLEIGPGFGGFAIYAAKNYGVRMTLLTNSVRQKSYLENICEAHGVTNLVDVQLRHPKDLQQKYDRVIMIEHIERIGDLTWPGFFRNIHDCLVPGGRMELQTIILAQNRYKHKGSFMCTDIKKGCRLVEAHELNQYITNAGFLDLGHISFGQDYAQTIMHWHQNFINKWPQIQLLGYDAKFRRLFILCMSYCAAGFKSGTLEIIQKSIVKPA